MKIRDFFYCNVEKELDSWIHGFSDIHELYENRASILSKLEHQCILGHVEDGVIMDGPVHVGIGSIVRSGAVLSGQVVIGENTVIESNAVIQGGVYVGSNCKISALSLINNCVCFNNVFIHAGACLSGSVVGSNCHIGENCVVGCQNTDSETSLPSSTIIGDEVILASGTIQPRGVVVKAKYASKYGEIVS